MKLNLCMNLFQFLHGAIKGKNLKSVAISISYFNSYMVRLRAACKKIPTPKSAEFQFLHGAIKGNTACKSRLAQTDFNSYMVRLRAYSFCLI